MPLARNIPLARSFQLVLAMALAGCQDAAYRSDDDTTSLEEALGYGPEQERRRKKLTLYVDPDTNASDQAAEWAASDPVGAARMEIIASQQIGYWVGDWTNDPAGEIDAAINEAGTALRTFVVYNIPGRDCGFWSAGGAADAAEYDAFIADVAAGLAGRPAGIILEPDALPLAEDCGFSQSEIDERYTMIADAVDTLTAAGAAVYIDAGDSNWIPSDQMADRLDAANVHGARGFALNTSHTEWTDDEVGYAEELRALLGTDVHYVVDTGRNGLGPSPDNEWCNPYGRALGEFPTLKTGVVGMDAKLWTKPPGESDGSCNGGPVAGAWWPEYADDLAAAAGF